MQITHTQLQVSKWVIVHLLVPALPNPSCCMCYAFPLLLSLHSQSNPEGCRFLERQRKGCNKRGPGGAVGQGEWWVGLPATAASWHVLSPYCPGRLSVFGLRYRETSSVQSATWHWKPVEINEPVRRCCHCYRHLSLSLRCWVTGSTMIRGRRIFEVGKG